MQTIFTAILKTCVRVSLAVMHKSSLSASYQRVVASARFALAHRFASLQDLLRSCQAWSTKQSSASCLNLPLGQKNQKNVFDRPSSSSLYRVCSLDLPNERIGKSSMNTWRSSTGHNITWEQLRNSHCTRWTVTCHHAIQKRQ